MSKKTVKTIDKSAEFSLTGSKKRRPLLAIDADPDDLDAVSVRHLRPRSLEEIREQMIHQMKTTMGASLDLSPGSTIRMFIDVQAVQFAQLEESMVTVMRNMYEELQPPTVLTVKGDVTPETMARIKAFQDSHGGSRPIIVDTETVTYLGPRKTLTKEAQARLDAVVESYKTPAGRTTTPAFLQHQAMSVMGVLACEIEETRPGYATFILTIEDGRHAPNIIKHVKAVLEPHRPMGVEFNVIQSGKAP